MHFVICRITNSAHINQNIVFVQRNHIDFFTDDEHRGLSRYNNYTIILPFWLLMNVIKMKLKCCLPIDDTPDCQTCSWCCMVTSKVIYYCSNSLLYTEVPCLAAMSTDSGNHSSGSYSPTSWTIYTNSCIFSSTGRYILLSIGAPNSMCLDKNMR